MGRVHDRQSNGDKPKLTRIWKRIELALRELEETDWYLLASDVSERAITHRLALYLQNMLPMWKVDCEWNRSVNAEGEIEPLAIELKYFLDRMLCEINLILESYYSATLEAKCENGSINSRDSIEVLKSLEKQLKETEPIFDENIGTWVMVLRTLDNKEIRKRVFPDIVCHLRDQQFNEFVIEVKKNSNRDEMSYTYDIIKLICLTRGLKHSFRYGYFIEIPATLSPKHLTTFKRSRPSLIPEDKKVWEVIPSRLL
jgi:hypothetical protein